MPRAVIATLVLLAAATGAAGAVETLTVEGLLVDVACYARASQSGRAGETLDAAAVRACGPGDARAGMPVAVLPGGKIGAALVTLASPSHLLAEHLGRDARLAGEVIAPNVVKPVRLEVDTGQGWREIPTMGMM